MLKIESKKEFEMNKSIIYRKIKKGAVFIHPTDTIYGIGCDATIKESVKKVRLMKGRAVIPFSVIAPSIDWIRENCEVDKEGEKWLKKLPGAYTLIFKLKNKKCIAKEVNNNLNTLGIRMPKHWFSDTAKELGIPIITTSANKSGDYFMTSLENLNPEIKSKLNFVIYEGEIKGRPSTLVNLTKKKIEIKKR